MIAGQRRRPVPPERSCAASEWPGVAPDGYTRNRANLHDWPDIHVPGKVAGFCCGAEQILCLQAPELPRVLLVQQMVGVRHAELVPVES